MMASARVGSISHSSFPKDGKLRWVRWIDGINVRGLGTSTPIIQVYLAPLPDNMGRANLPHIKDVASFQEASPYPVHVGALPTIGLGAVYLDGARVGDLRMDQSGSMRFTAGHARSLVACGDANPMPKPSWWKYRWSLVPSGRYQPAGSGPHWCEQFHNTEHQLIIPCSEVFRAFCAPETRLANALLSGPWSSIYPQIVNESWCDQESTPWQMGLRSGLTGISALPTAAYYWTAWGRQVASRLNASAVNAPAELNPMQAQMPYEFDEAIFDCDGFWIGDLPEPRRFMALRIRKATFPCGFCNLPPHVEFRLDNFNTERRPRDDTSGLPIQIPRPTPAEGEQGRPADAEVDQNPSGSAGMASVGGIEPVMMVGVPEVSRMVIEPSTLPRRPVIVRDEPTNRGSFGKPGGRASDLGSFKLGKDGEDLSRVVPAFAAVQNLLDALCRDGTIDSWTPFLPEDMPSFYLGGLAACRLPLQVDGRTRRWARMPSGRRRACLVSEIISSGIKIYWLELERRPSGKGGKEEGFCYLLLKCGSDQLRHALELLMASVVLGHGEWPEEPPTGMPLGSVFRSHRHHYGSNRELKTKSTASKLDALTRT